MLFISAHSDDITFCQIPINSGFRNSMAMALGNGNESSSAAIVDVTSENSSFELVEPDSTSETTVDDNQFYFPNAANDVQLTTNNSLCERQNNEADSSGQCVEMIDMIETDNRVKQFKHAKLPSNKGLSEHFGEQSIGNEKNNIISSMFCVPSTSSNFSSNGSSTNATFQKENYETIRKQLINIE